MRTHLSTKQTLPLLIPPGYTTRILNNGVPILELEKGNSPRVKEALKENKRLLDGQRIPEFNLQEISSNPSYCNEFLDELISKWGMVGLRIEESSMNLLNQAIDVMNRILDSRNRNPSLNECVKIHENPLPFSPNIAGFQESISEGAFVFSILDRSYPPNSSRRKQLNVLPNSIEETDISMIYKALDEFHSINTTLLTGITSACSEEITPKELLSQIFGNNIKSAMTAVHYDSLKERKARNGSFAMRMGQHVHVNPLYTLIFMSSPGLEIQRQDAQEWYRPILPDNTIGIISDQKLSMLHKKDAAIHRVIQRSPEEWSQPRTSLIFSQSAWEERI